MVTNVLDIVGATLIIAFCALIWWPLGLAAAGVLCLLASFLIERRSAS